MKRLFAGICLAVFLLASPLAQAGSPQQIACEGSGGKWVNSTCKEDTANGPRLLKTVTTIVNLLLFLVGLIAVIALIISGVRFVSANGDPQQVSKAKNSIIYAVIGIVVAFMAFAIVNFVASQLEQASKKPPPRARSEEA